ncbi:MAG: HD domain-containing protein [Planctomycetes bacterium]|nr:HD domain-containing protein [Planctomycetota bacterium]
MASPLLEALLTLQCLQDLPRTGWIQRGIVPQETIAGHILGVCELVLALGPAVEPPLDSERCLALALVHDAPEALLGDLPRTAAELLPEGAKRHAEARAAERVLGPLSALARERFEEHARGVSREARFTRVCDRLQLGLRLLGYRRTGQAGLEEFEATLRELDCGEFEPARGLQRELVAELERLRRAGL